MIRVCNSRYQEKNGKKFDDCGDEVYVKTTEEYEENPSGRNTSTTRRRFIRN